MNKQLQNPRGMPDLSPGDEAIWLKLMRAVLAVSREFDFHYVETPLVEDVSLFERGVGETSDIVEKEMFYLKSREDGVTFALRPEGTAPVMRAYIQHGWMSLPQPIKVFYLGPMFRYERPQAGRLREHHQWGLEMLGTDEPIDDAMVMSMAHEFLKRVGVEGVTFSVNSIGDKTCRGDLKNALKTYYRSKMKNLCPDCQRRYQTNPFRLLDCKNEKCGMYKEKAPILIDFLCAECKEHFKTVLRYLDENNIPYELDNTLVRGLDYYTRTVFEVKYAEKGISFGGGGRYDDLGTMLGSKAPVSAVGLAMGLERIASLVKELQPKMAAPEKPDVFLVAIGDFAKARSIALVGELSRAGISVGFAFGKKTLKEQLGLANDLKVKYVLILGQREVSDKTVIFKDMTLGSQEIIKVERIIEEIQNKIQ